MQIIISKKSDPGFKSDPDWERLIRAAGREVSNRASTVAQVVAWRFNSRFGLTNHVEV
jgi:hypothetical protein